MAREPRLWLGLRRLDALGLGLCALTLGAAGSAAATLPDATDPSAAGPQLVWQQPGRLGMLLHESGAIGGLPGSHPALGQSTIAWAGVERITVADRLALRPRATVRATGVNALAVSDSWLVYRDQDAQGAEHLIGVSLSAPARRRYIYGSRLAGEVGRPALDGARLVFAIGTPAASAIELLDLTNGRRRRVRVARQLASLLNPSLLGGQLLFERVTRCSQQLRIGSATARRGERVLLSMPSTVLRDPGYQRGYRHAYNRASRCRIRAAGPGVRTLLGPTALSASAAYVTEFGAAGDAQIVKLPR